MSRDSHRFTPIDTSEKTAPSPEELMTDEEVTALREKEGAESEARLKRYIAEHPEHAELIAKWR